MKAQMEESLTDTMERYTSELLAVTPEATRVSLGRMANDLCNVPETLYQNPETRHVAMILAMMVSTRLVPLLEAFDAEFGQGKKNVNQD